ncbi:50S ribosome-binding GTPase [Yoonia tamlensis]|uniref:50S ribosome-binding GTPase n=1 Tax=Yoonia tamlensis TaxID=390270 RepID=A0A1I6I1V9_9RHOB|nr:GTPase [Yoonia tamlensis]SFR60440.1 50S ribosome-binding GTPase [Yoonia tamlensis]
MSNQSLAMRVHEELKQAVASGLLPDAAHKRAMQLAGRLDQPVRIALMGMQNSGKSRILNLLVGSKVIPENVNLPTVQLTYGDTTQAICTLEDGTKKTLDHFGDKTTFETVDVLKIIAVKPTFVELRIPLPALKKISVLDVASPADPEALSASSQWAAKRCEVAMWCTKGYVPSEQAIWAQMPDIIKDHAFLMLTHADQIAAAGKLDIAMTAVRKAAGDEFNHVLPIATLDALASRGADGTVDKEKMRSSGGTALIGAVLKVVDQGRQSFVDMGDILLVQNAEILAGNDKTAASQPAEKEAAAPVATNHSVELSVAQSTAASSANAAASVVTLHPDTRSAYETALAYIAEQSKILAQIVANADDGAPGEIIAHASDQVMWVCDYLNENGDASDKALQQTRDMSFDAADLVQLMQMEKNDGAAIDALSLLLQIKHELQADLAA